MGIGFGFIGDDGLRMGKLLLGGAYALLQFVDEVLIVR